MIDVGWVTWRFRDWGVGEKEGKELSRVIFLYSLFSLFSLHYTLTLCTICQSIHLDVQSTLLSFPLQ